MPEDFTPFTIDDGDQDAWISPPTVAEATAALSVALDALDEPAPNADEYGRLRVHDKDTGHALTVSVAGLPHGNFAVLDEPASDATGLPLQPEHNRFSVEPTTNGQAAENEEKDND